MRQAGHKPGRKGKDMNTYKIEIVNNRTRESIITIQITAKHLTSRHYHYIRNWTANEAKWDYLDEHANCSMISARIERNGQRIGTITDGIGYGGQPWSWIHNGRSGCFTRDYLFN